MPMKIVCDADGLIKTHKAGILATFAQHARLFIGPEVVREVITAGKAQGYPDAFEIEQIVAQHMHQTAPRSDAQAELRLPVANFGAGEREALAVEAARRALATLRPMIRNEQYHAALADLSTLERR